MNSNYTQQTILITGASAGLGQAMAHELSKHECTLILAARRSNALNAVAASLASENVTVHVLPLDLENQKSILRASSRLKELCTHIDVLVNNAGISQRSHALETETAVIRKIMEVNFLGTIDWTNHCLPLLQQSKSPQIIVISSVVGHFGFKERSAYAASKHALQGYFESMQLESDQPAVTIVSPGRIHTEISKHALTASGIPHGKMDAGQAKGMNPQAAARRILRAASKKKRQVFLGSSEVLMIYIHRYFPSLFRRIAKGVSAR